LKDQITYRIPGKPVVQRNGVFEKVSDEIVPAGFIISPFPGKDLFYLNENKMYSTDQSLFLAQPKVISKEDYLLIAEAFLGELRSGHLGKAVFSRVKAVSIELEDLRDVFVKLCDTYPTSFIYLLKSSSFGTWIGATPESLLKCESSSCSTVSLAGTIPDVSGSKWTQKERVEQQLVTDDIVSVLAESQCDDIVCSEVRDVVAGPVRHLRTDVSFQFEGQYGALASAIHPTPAVSGFPRTDALRLISKFESHNRELYTGFLGEIGEDTCDLFVNLRCSRIVDDRAYLFVGGGFTPDSIPEMEWEETENKAKTLMQVLASR